MRKLGAMGGDHTDNLNRKAEEWRKGFGEKKA